jgi:hypothetical protein
MSPPQVLLCIAECFLAAGQPGKALAYSGRVNMVPGSHAVPASLKISLQGLIAQDKVGEAAAHLCQWLQNCPTGLDSISMLEVFLTSISLHEHAASLTQLLNTVADITMQHGGQLALTVVSKLCSLQVRFY